jgi:hypothetical protein
MMQQAYVSLSADGMIYMFCKLGAGSLFATLLISIPQIVRGDRFFDLAFVWVTLAGALCLMNMAFGIYVAPVGLRTYSITATIIGSGIMRAKSWYQVLLS